MFRVIKDKDMGIVQELIKNNSPKEVFMTDNISVHGRVLEIDGNIIGCSMFQNYNHKIFLIHLVIDKSCRRMGFGSFMLHQIKDMLSENLRYKIEIIIHEKDKGTLDFFISQGFRAVRVHKDMYNDGDGFEMIFMQKENQ